MKNNLNRIILFFVIIVIGVTLVEIKKGVIRNKKNQKVESPLSLFIEKGAPVHITTVTPQSLQAFKLGTVEPCSQNKLCTYVSGFERKSIKPKQEVVSAKDDDKLGQVESISNHRVLSNGLYRVIINPLKNNKNKEVQLAKIITGVFNNVLAVPSSSLHQDGDDYFVWKVHTNHQTAEKVAVKIGKKGANKVEILDGVEQGTEIVLRGAEQIEKYKKLRVIKTVNPTDHPPKA